MKYNRLKELFCCLFGHEFNESGSRTDNETGIVLSYYEQCEHCGIRIVDETGVMEVYNLKYGVAEKKQKRKI